MVVPAILGAAALGAAGSMAFEYIMSSGEATKQDYVVAGVVGALPVGLGARGAAGLGQKALALRHVRKGDRAGDVAYVYMHPSSKVFLGPEAKAIGSGVLANVAVGYALDVYGSRGGQGSSLPSIPGAANGRSIPSPSAKASGARLRGRGSPRSSGGRDAAPKKCGAWNPHRPYQCVKPRGHRGLHYNSKTGSFSSNVYF